MRRVSIFSFFLAALLLVASGMVTAKDTAHKYVGAKKCKTCHKANFKSWSETGHAKAYDLLSDDEKKKPECTKCHITGTTAKGVLLEGVQCEACHGPGSAYKSPKIMSKKKWKADPKKHEQMAIDAGLILPTEETCVRCHTKEGNANFKEFKFEERKLKVHPKEDGAKK